MSNVVGTSEDVILYEGPLPFLTGRFRLVKSASTDFLYLDYESVIYPSGAHDAWRSMTSSGERAPLYQYAFTEALKLAVLKLLRDKDLLGDGAR